MVTGTCVPVEDLKCIVPYEHRTTVIQPRVTTIVPAEERTSYVAPREGNC